MKWTLSRSERNLSLSDTDDANPFKGRIQLWGHPIAVDWAEPEVEVDEDTMSSVKILYVRNLMLSTTEETIEKEFNSIKQGRNPLTQPLSACCYCKWKYFFIHKMTKEDKK